MAKAPESDKKGLTIEELLTGIGKLLYKLNESVDNSSSRLEKLENNLLSLLQEKLDGIADQLVKSNELLAADSVDKKIFIKELGKVTKQLSDSTKSIEKTLKDVIKQSDKTRGEVLTEKLQAVVDGISGITGKIEGGVKSIEDNLDRIETSTVERVSSINETVRENSQIQKEQLEEMTKLLSLHSVEVKDNRVSDLNRSAIVHFNNAEYEQALSSLQDAIELSPDNPGLLANIAHVLASQGNLAEAEENFRKALKADPDLEPAISGLGTILVHTGRANETIEFLRKIFERDSEPSIGINIAMSRAYAAEGNHSKAIALLEQAEKIAPGNPELEQELAKYQ
ncbi:MAG: tetratricopeptide repeat protein [Candidatus Fermentibacteraceae bacterium]|nr:tetratricopeptide repeat protein [Candidatus Fermentibacteraceae bacterium]